MRLIVITEPNCITWGFGLSKFETAVFHCLFLRTCREEDITQYPRDFFYSVPRRFNQQDLPDSFDIKKHLN